MGKIDLIIDALLVAPPSVWSTRMDQALFVARELKLELAANETEIERLRRDALRYRWLNKYTSQLFMVTEPQMNYEVDRAMSGGVLNSNKTPCQCIDQFWCETFDRCKKNETK
jgi:1,2-phenylacetyl-CoA epoxidase catalytic subunit